MSKRAVRACVVGGGPAGLAAAIALAREGFPVTLVDCARPPIDKSCGEGLMPDSLATLRELGIELPPSLGFPFDGIRFADGRSSIRARFSHGAGRGVRRTVLHQLLVQEAQRRGVAFLWGAKHAELDRELAGADFVVGADGQNSRIQKQAGLSQIVHERRRYGFRRHYRMPPWSSCVELHWGPNCQLYMTPVAPDEVCVALISRDSRLRLDEALDCFPELRSQLARGVPVTADMGAVTATRKLRSVQNGRVALVGDASGSVDAITGQGMCLAFQQAVALASALRCGNPAGYQATHAQLMRRPRMMASLLLALSRHDRLRHRALAGLARRPALFESLVAIHVGASPLTDLCSWNLVGFGVGLLNAWAARL